MSLGLLLLAAFIAVVQRCREGFSTNESLAALQDNARHALSVMLQDLEHAGFLGYSGAAAVQYTRGGAVLAEGADLHQPDAAHAVAAVPGLPAGAHDCGENYALDLDLAVQGTNNSYSSARATDCPPTPAAGGSHAGSDTLTVRHAALETTKPLAGRLQLYSRRTESHGTAWLFADGRAPGPVDVDTEVRDLEVHRYYIANDSVDRPHWPALRVKSLTESRGAVQFRDEEVLPGVEDLQVEFGVRDPGDPDGRLSFVTADFPELRDRRLVAIRLWLRIRADRTEAGYFDTRPMQYAGMEFTPDAVESRQRRLLVQRTVALRNVREP